LSLGKLHGEPASYLAVAAFVLILMLGGIGFAVWSAKIRRGGGTLKFTIISFSAGGPGADYR
jgi:hypothetical protein